MLIGRHQPFVIITMICISHICDTTTTTSAPTDNFSTTVSVETQSNANSYMTSSMSTSLTSRTSNTADISTIETNTASVIAESSFTIATTSVLLVNTTVPTNMSVTGLTMELSTSPQTPPTALSVNTDFSVTGSEAMFTTSYATSVSNLTSSASSVVSKNTTLTTSLDPLTSTSESIITYGPELGSPTTGSPSLTSLSANVTFSNATASSMGENYSTGSDAVPPTPYTSSTEQLTTSSSTLNTIPLTSASPSLSSVLSTTSSSNSSATSSTLPAISTSPPATTLFITNWFATDSAKPITVVVTTVATTQDTNSTTTTTTSTTTTATTKAATATTTTIATAPVGSISINLKNQYFITSMTVSYVVVFDIALYDTTSTTYASCATQIVGHINEAFLGCPGFIPSLTKVLNFFAGSTVANVSTSFDAAYVIQNTISSTAINKYLLTTGIPELGNTTLTVNGAIGVANVTYLNTVTAAQINASSQTFSSYQQNPCKAGSWCPSCSICGVDSTSLNMYCYPLCQAPAYTCYISNFSSTATCGCSEYYLLMAGSCVDQNIIIGVFAGVGGALFVALIIFVIYSSCKHGTNDKPLDSESRWSVRSSQGLVSIKRDDQHQQESMSPIVIAREPESDGKILKQSLSSPDNMTRTNVENVPDRTLHTPAYLNFRAQLQHIDYESMITLARPKLAPEHSNVALNEDWQSDRKSL